MRGQESHVVKRSTAAESFRPRRHTKSAAALKQHKDENLEPQDETWHWTRHKLSTYPGGKGQLYCTESLRHQMWTRGVGEAVKGDHFPMWHLSPASKCLHWEEWKWSFWVYRVCNWPEIELSALIHPEWAAKSWLLCVFSSCFITVGRTVSTLILSWLESVSEIS